jgi:hypothetical protein
MDERELFKTGYFLPTIFHLMLFFMIIMIIIIIIIMFYKIEGHIRKIFDRLSTKDIYMWNITHNTGITAV